ncbi:hypothetical protein FIBSPDRAFT_919592 [Athelia psychrophila]|uniref:F-box domain-containing protein n=1 Tax=Athelia psychrophila TaxID=1759441 RepID=A0A166JWA8_9AGAM|nr:hypothetical protein FIBSPDRAFT_919592 [Fibularhizoctonia sp. CBS 109695]
MRDLNLDVLELIFSHLPSGNDLTSVALVSRSFFAGVIPRLYEELHFRSKQAKRYSTIVAPFAALLKHPHRAVHVRTIDIRAVPALKDAVPAHMHPVFLKDSADALAICNNVTSFTCVCPILPHFLLSLQNKPSLRDIRINAHLTSDQTAKLIQLEALHSITLDNASWNVIDALPKWIIANKSTLTSLTIYSANELNEQVLERSLVELPRLINLHIINCQNLSLPGVLKCLVYTPLLESLSVTTFMHSESLQMNAPYPPLRNLLHLSLDCKSGLAGPPSAVHNNSLLSRFFSDILLASSPPLRTLSIRLADRSLSIPEQWLDAVLCTYGGTLRTVSFGQCLVSVEAITKICDKSTSLERLEVPLPVKELRPYTLAAAKSSTITTLIDLSDQHATHTPKVALGKDSIKFMMTTIPSLQTVECDGRIWKRREGPKDGSAVRLSLEGQKIVPSQHWFMRD